MLFRTHGLTPADEALSIQVLCEPSTPPDSAAYVGELRDVTVRRGVPAEAGARGKQVSLSLKLPGNMRLVRKEFG